MAKGNFEKSTKWCLVHEGGFVNHPDDPGGATMMGVIQRTYDGYRDRMGRPRQSVKKIIMAEVMDIYKSQYWDLINGDDLPSGLDYAVYDFSINSGPSRAVKFLQEILGVKVDGMMGNATLGAIRNRNDIDGLIQELCIKRWKWMQRLSTFKTFGKGWTRRVMGDIIDGVQPNRDTGVIDRAILLYQGNSSIPMPLISAPGKAEDEDLSASATAVDSLSLTNIAKVGGGIVPGAIASASVLPAGPLQWAAAAIAVVAAILVVWIIVRKLK